MKQRIIQSAEDAAELIEALSVSSRKALDSLHSSHGTMEPLRAMWTLKFDPAGCDPLDSDRPLNLIEQINQTFTYLASLRAAQLLLRLHPELAPFRLNLGTAPGWDIESASHGELAAEVFAAVSTSSNRKLANDRARLAEANARLRYIFFMCPGYEESRQPKLETAGIKVWSLNGSV